MNVGDGDKLVEWYCNKCYNFRKQGYRNYCTTVHALEQFNMIDSPAHIRLNCFREIIRFGTSIEFNFNSKNGTYIHV